MANANGNQVNPFDILTRGLPIAGKGIVSAYNDAKDVEKYGPQEGKSSKDIFKEALGNYQQQAKEAFNAGHTADMVDFLPAPENRNAVMLGRGARESEKNPNSPGNLFARSNLFLNSDRAPHLIGEKDLVTKQQRANENKDKVNSSDYQRNYVNQYLVSQGVNPTAYNGMLATAGWLNDTFGTGYNGPTGIWETDENGNLKILGMDAVGTASGAPGYAMSGDIAKNYNLRKNQDRYDGMMDSNDDGMVDAEEQQAFYQGLEDQLIKTYGQEAYDAAGYNREGGNFRIQDGVLQNYDYTTGDWTNSMYDLNDDGTFNLTIDGKQALDDDSRQMAMYMMLNSMNGVTGDSWGARQFYRGDGADDWWWRTMNNSPVSGHYDYMRNAVDENGNSIWGDDGQMSMDEWLAWRDAWDGDMMNADVLRQQALYGNVGLGMNSTNAYLAANGIDLNPYGDAMMYLDAASLSDDQKAQLGLNDSMADQYGRFRITAEGNPNAVGLMNLMSASSLLADGGMTDALNQDELNQLMELAGLSDRFNVDPTGSGGVSDEFAPWNAQGYDPEYFRTYQWDEFNPETEMPRFDLNMFNNQLAADYLNRNFGFSRMEA